MFQIKDDFFIGKFYCLLVIQKDRREKWHRNIKEKDRERERDVNVDKQRMRYKR